MFTRNLPWKTSLLEIGSLKKDNIEYEEIAYAVSKQVQFKQEMLICYWDSEVIGSTVLQEKLNKTL